DVADAEPVDHHHAGPDLAGPVGPAVGRQLDDVAVLADEDVLAGHAGGGGQAGVLGQVPVLAVDGQEVAWPQGGQQQGQLPLGGVAGDVHAGVALVVDLGPEPGQVVDGAVDGGLVARDQRGRQHHGVARLDPDPLVVAAG